MSTSAADAVSDSDLPLTSGSDVDTSEITALSDEIPADLGEPQIVMNMTDESIGQSLEFFIDASKLWIDWGDGTPEYYERNLGTTFHVSPGVRYKCTAYSGTIKGATVNIYTDESIKLFDVYSDFISLDVRKLSELEVLNCFGKEQFTTLDVSNNVNLKYLQFGGILVTSSISSIDISNNKKLIRFGFCYTNITSLDLSENTKLEILSCYNSKLSSLNISNNTQLRDISCFNNNLSELDISNNKNLIFLICNGNKIKSLDTSKNSALQYLICGGADSTIPVVALNPETDEWYYENFDSSFLGLSGGNNFTKLDVSNNPNLKYLYCEENNLKFSTINLGDVSLETFSYKNQNKVTIASSIEAGKTIDLSSEYDIDGTKTVYKWFDSSDNEITPTKSENGVFTFGDEFVSQTLHCTMTNALYPDLTLETTEVEVEEGGLTIEDNVGIVEEATPSDGIVVRDENGNIISLGKVKLIVNHVEESKKKSILEAIEKYNKEFDADSNDCALFDISLADKSNAKVTIEKGSGKIKIRIKYPQGLSGNKEDYKFNLYHQKSDGSIEEIAITCESNGIWFYADDFSPYILTWSLKSSGGSTDTGKGPSTGESIAMTVVAACLAALSLAAIGTVIYKKKFLTSAK